MGHTLSGANLRGWQAQGSKPVLHHRLLVASTELTSWHSIPGQACVVRPLAPPLRDTLFGQASLHLHGTRIFAEWAVKDDVVASYQIFFLQNLAPDLAGQNRMEALC